MSLDELLRTEATIDRLIAERDQAQAHVRTLAMRADILMDRAVALLAERDRLRAAIVAYRTAAKACDGIADAKQALFAALGEE